MTNHYEVLGVPRTADQTAIKAVFRARTRAVHPDAPGGGDPASMAALNEAYEVLSDPVRRAAHDAKLDAAAEAAAPQPDPAPPYEPVAEPVAPAPAPVEVTPRTVVGGWSMILSVLALIVAVVVFVVARRPEADGTGDVLALVLLAAAWVTWWGRGGWRTPLVAAAVGAAWYWGQGGAPTAAWWGSAGVMLGAFVLLAVAKATTRGGDR